MAVPGMRSIEKISSMLQEWTELNFFSRMSQLKNVHSGTSSVLWESEVIAHMKTQDPARTGGFT